MSLSQQALFQRTVILLLTTNRIGIIRERIVRWAQALSIHIPYSKKRDIISCIRAHTT